MTVLRVGDDACDRAVAGRKMLNMSEGKSLRAGAGVSD
jgi:hypothetical protein